MSTFEVASPRETSLPTSVRISVFESADERRWNDFVAAHPDGTFFHQVAWKRVTEKTYGFEPHYFYAERGGTITGVAPAFLTSSWLSGKALLSLPFAVYGGVCASDRESESALVAHL